MTIEGRTDGASGSALDAVAEASRALTTGGTLREALASIAAAAASATGAEVVVARVLAADARQLKAHAVWAVSPAVAAELEGSRFAVEELPAAEVDEVARLPKAVQLAAERARAGAVLQVPIVLDDAVLASLELMRPRMRFSADERVLARLFAHQIGLAIRAFGAHGAAGERDGANGTLELAGEALAAGSDELRTAEQVTRLATDATGALGALLWRAAEADAGLELLGSFGLQAAEPAVARAGEAAERALAERQPVAVEGRTATILLGEPPVGALQLLFARGDPPTDEALAHLSTFGVRVADALRAGERARSLAGELERTRTLLGVVGQAIAQLSLAHTLETAVGRVAELLGAERLAVYLRDDGRLGAAAGRGLAGPHVRVAERLLELAVGPYRGRGILVVEDAAADPQLSPAADAVAEAGIDAAVAPPARRARPRGARARRRLRVVGAGRRRRRRLRLPPAPGRPARGRARRRYGARDRGHGRHGDGEVRLPLARARAPRARRLPRLRERRRRRRDRAGQVHHHGLPRRGCGRRRGRLRLRRSPAAPDRRRRRSGGAARRDRPRARDRRRAELSRGSRAARAGGERRRLHGRRRRGPPRQRALRTRAARRGPRARRRPERRGAGRGGRRELPPVRPRPG